MSAPDRATRQSLHQRVRLVRQELFGDERVQELADALRVPIENWLGIEQGRAMLSGQLFLRFIDETNANPLWLLTGEGDRFKSEVTLPTSATA